MATPLSEAKLTPREAKVLRALRAAGGPLTARELGRTCFPGLRAKPGTYERTAASGEKIRHGTAAAYRCVLNSVRRLVAGGIVRRVSRGTYAATEAALLPRGEAQTARPA